MNEKEMTREDAVTIVRAYLMGKDPTVTKEHVLEAFRRYPYIYDRLLLLIKPTEPPEWVKPFLDEMVKIKNEALKKHE